MAMGLVAGRHSLRFPHVLPARLYVSLCGGGNIARIPVCCLPVFESCMSNLQCARANYLTFASMHVLWVRRKEVQGLIGGSAAF